MTSTIPPSSSTNILFLALKYLIASCCGSYTTATIQTTCFLINNQSLPELNVNFCIFICCVLCCSAFSKWATAGLARCTRPTCPTTLGGHRLTVPWSSSSVPSMRARSILLESGCNRLCLNPTGSSLLKSSSRIRRKIERWVLAIAAEKKSQLYHILTLATSFVPTLHNFLQNITACFLDNIYNFLENISMLMHSF